MTRSRREATLSLTGENSNTEAPSCDLVSIPTPARSLSPLATSEYERVQPLSRSLVPKPLYVQLYLIGTTSPHTATEDLSSEVTFLLDCIWVNLLMFCLVILICSTHTHANPHTQIKITIMHDLDINSLEQNVKRAVSKAS